MQQVRMHGSRLQRLHQANQPALLLGASRSLLYLRPKAVEAESDGASMKKRQGKDIRMDMLARLQNIRGSLTRIVDREILYTNPRPSVGEIAVQMRELASAFIDFIEHVEATKR